MQIQMSSTEPPFSISADRIHLSITTLAATKLFIPDYLDGLEARIKKAVNYFRKLEEEKNMLTN